MLRIRFPYYPGLNLAISVQRVCDGLRFDFGDRSFKAAPAQPTIPVAEDAGIFAGRYALEYGPTPGPTWWNGAYVVTAHDLGSGKAPRVVGEFAVEFQNGANSQSYPDAFAY